MTKDYNSSNNNRRRTSDSSNRDSRDRGFNRNNHSRNNNYKNYKKSSILLKSTVYSLGIVLAVLVVAFFIIKQNKDLLSTSGNMLTHKPKKCNKSAKAIEISGKIKQITTSGPETIILVEGNRNQEIIKLDPCLNEISRNSFIR